MNKFKVPAIFDKKYIDSLIELNKKYSNSKVIETYGCLPYDLVGSSRVGSQLPETDKENLKEYIQYARKNGIEFNYIMNTTCHGNVSHVEFNKLLHEQMKILLELGVKIITVSTPYMMEFLKNNYPEINVIASINMCTSSVSQIQQLEEMGVSRVVVDRNLNRNFKLLKDLKNCSDVDLELLANSMCLPFCIMHQYHNNLNSHYIDGTDEELIQCYPYAKCFSRYIENPILMMCSGWIRPEDLKKYESTGIDKFKIDGRGIAKDTILSVIEPYMAEKFNGNVFDLMFSGRLTRQSVSAYLDNDKLSEFLDNIIDNDIDCRYCGGRNQKCLKLSKQIQFDENKRQNFIEMSKKDVNNIFN